MPQNAKYLKTLLEDKRKVKSAIVNFLKQVSVIIQGTFAKKEKARGPFVLPLTLGKLNSKGALANLKASISLMLMSIAIQLAFELKASKKLSRLLTKQKMMLKQVSIILIMTLTLNI